MRLALSAAAIALLAGTACARRAPDSPLIPATTTMVTAWQIPLNPLADPSLTDPKLGDQIRWGYKIFTDTPHEAPRFTGGMVSCANCRKRRAI